MQMVSSVDRCTLNENVLDSSEKESKKYSICQLMFGEKINGTCLRCHSLRPQDWKSWVNMNLPDRF